jgi:galactokinase
MMPVNTPELIRLYRETFPSSLPSLIVRAPGRVNLIGEHTDYNDGFVLPIATRQSLYVIAGSSDTNQIVVHSTAYDETVTFSSHYPGPPGQPHWSNYVRGMAALLLRNDVALRGGFLLIHSELPVGGGLSSSAAIEIGSAMAFLSLAKTKMEPMPLALLARQAEHEYAGSPCGIMDQFICVLGQAGHALLLDCRSQSSEHVPLPDKVNLVLMNTQVKHDLAASEYPLRQQECRKGLEILRRECPDVAALRDLSMKDFRECARRLNETTFKRCRHVITEIERTLAAAQALRQEDFMSFGDLMLKSHESLRDDYAVSCPELDALVEIARAVPGVYGARMTGGGFGGCAIALARLGAEEALRLAIQEQYNTRFAKPALVDTTPAGEGVCLQLL